MRFGFRVRGTSPDLASNLESRGYVGRGAERSPPGRGAHGPEDYFQRVLPQVGTGRPDFTR